MMSHMDVSCMAPVQPENWGHAEWPLGAHLTEDGAANPTNSKIVMKDWPTSSPVNEGSASRGLRRPKLSSQS